MSELKDFAIKDGVLVKYIGTEDDVIIPAGVTSIGQHAFFNCRRIKSVVIPDTVTSIGDSAFWMCSSLTSITIPASVESIGAGAFISCDSLTNVTIPDRCTNIGDAAFKRCAGLADEQGFVIKKNILFDYFGKETDVEIPIGVTHIGKEAFYQFRGLKSVYLPEGVRSIGNNAFNYCRSLVKITIPMSIESIDEGAFSNCDNLSEIYMPEEKAELLSSQNIDAWPKNLIPAIGKIYKHLDDKTVNNLILKKSIWNKLDPLVQADLYTIHQDDTFAETYKKLLGTKQIKTLTIGVEKLLESSVSSKQVLAAANYLIKYSEELDTETISRIYELIRQQNDNDDALSAISTDAYLKTILLTSSQEEPSFTPVAEKTMGFMEEQGKTIHSLQTTLQDYCRLDIKDYSPLTDTSGNIVENFVTAWLLMEHDTVHSQLKFHSTPLYNKSGIDDKAREIIVMLDHESFMTTLREIAENCLGISGNDRRMLAAYPICRYADEALMAELTKKAPKWRSAVSGNDAPPLRTFRDAVKFSDTRAAMLFADKYNELDKYAELRGRDIQELRDEFMSDVGLDENGKKTYDLGNTVIELTIGNDLNLNLYDTRTGKTVKSMPKRGADEAKYLAAKENLSVLKKDIKKIVKARADLLFEAFLDGRVFKAEGWKKAYLENPLLNHVARLVVWEQAGKTFTLKDKTTIDAIGQPVNITDEPVKVAHPMEMKRTDLDDWQKYFTANHLKQPFEQIWEPVRELDKIVSERYKGSVLHLYRFVGKEKHGIIATGFFAYSENHQIELKDCELEFIDWPWRLNMDAGRADNITLGQFSIKNYSRCANHIVTMLDKWTIEDRILKDDVTVIDFMPGFTQAQIEDFIKTAMENNCTSVTANLMDYKNRTFSEFDPMDEFTLDL